MLYISSLFLFELSENVTFFPFSLLILDYTVRSPVP